MPIYLSHPKSEVIIRWDESLLDPTNINDLNLPDWDINVSNGIENDNLDEDFVRSGVLIVLEFEKVKSKHVLHTFIPSILCLSRMILSMSLPIKRK